MAYVYLLDMYKFVDRRLVETKDELKNLNEEPAEKKFLQGRSQALLDFQDFLLKNYIPKLPRRIRESYFGKKK